MLKKAERNCFEEGGEIGGEGRYQNKKMWEVSANNWESTLRVSSAEEGLRRKIRENSVENIEESSVLLSSLKNTQ